MSPERLTRVFTKLVNEYGLPPIRLHDLRHGAATPPVTSPDMDRIGCGCGCGCGGIGSGGKTILARRLAGLLTRR